MELLRLFMTACYLFAIQFSIQPFDFCLLQALPFLVLRNIPLQMVHFPLMISLALQVDPLTIFDQSLHLSNGFLEHVVFFGESHVFLIKVAIVKGQFVDFLVVEVTFVGDLLSFFEDA